MKSIILKIVVFLAILFSALSIIPAHSAFNTITTKPDEWMGGVSTESTIAWFVVIVLGFGFLFLESFLALMGFLFSQKKRRGAFWLFKLPGMFGIVISLLLAALMIGIDFDWKNNLFVCLYIFVPSLIYWLFGNQIRKYFPKTA